MVQGECGAVPQQTLVYSNHTTLNAYVLLFTYQVSAVVWIRLSKASANMCGPSWHYTKGHVAVQKRLNADNESILFHEL